MWLTTAIISISVVIILLLVRKSKKEGRLEEANNNLKGVVERVQKAKSLSDLPNDGKWLRRKPKGDK